MQLSRKRIETIAFGYWTSPSGELIIDELTSTEVGTESRTILIKED
jgi:hypothetical protein